MFPIFFGNKGICIIWPASIPRGGIKDGVLHGFRQGHLINDVDQYLIHGTNKKIFYQIYKSVAAINEKAIMKLLEEAIILDRPFRKQ